MDEAAMAGIEQVRQPARESFHQLVGDHSPRLFRLAYRMTGNAHDAEEVVQETLLRAYQRLDTFDGRSAVSTWLYRIAANCSIDLLRSRKKRGLDTSLDQESIPEPRSAAAPVDPEKSALSREINERVESALQTLTPMERAAFVLRHFQDLSIREIGAALALSETATKHAIFRAVQKVREALQVLR